MQLMAMNWKPNGKEKSKNEEIISANSNTGSVSCEKNLHLKIVVYYY